MAALLLASCAPAATDEGEAASSEEEIATEGEVTPALKLPDLAWIAPSTFSLQEPVVGVALVVDTFF